MKDELILATESSGLKTRLKGANGFVTAPAGLDQIFDPRQLWFGPRPRLEEDVRFRQLIPYILLCTADALAVYSRAKKGGDSRLAAKRSVGFGGHVTIDDAKSSNGTLDVAATIQQTVARELAEEVKIGEVIRRDFLGLISEDDAGVGSVHVGIVELWHVSSQEIAPAEDAIVDCEFVPFNQLHLLGDQWESWSQLSIEVVLARISSKQPSRNTE